MDDAKDESVERPPVSEDAVRVRPPKPVVTYAIAGICAVVYAFQWLMPAVTEAGDFYPLGGYVEPWRFLTSVFLHSPTSATHLLFNLMGLYVMGQFLEPFLGRARFVALYLLSALGGSVGSLMLVPALDLSAQASVFAWTQSMVGASGAVFGLFAAAFLVLRRTGAPVAGMVVLLAINLALPFVYPNIAWQAHLGGAVVGLVAAGLMFFTARPGRTKAQWPALIVLAAGLVVTAWIKYEVNGRALGVLIEHLQ